MLKALAYLKDDLENIDPRKLSTIQYLEECIKELEELEENHRDCSKCVHDYGDCGYNSEICHSCKHCKSSLQDDYFMEKSQ